MKEFVITEQIKALCQSFLDDSAKDSKAARARMRKATIMIAKLGKEFRRLSIEEEKNL